MSGNLNQSKPVNPIADAIMPLHDDVCHELAALRERLNYLESQTGPLRHKISALEQVAKDAADILRWSDAATKPLAPDPDDTDISEALPADGEPEGAVGPTWTQPCGECDGTGIRHGKTCPPCGGRGRVLSAADAKE